MDIRAPNKRAVDRDIAIAEIQLVHDLANIVGAFSEDDTAIIPALLERVENLRRIVGGTRSPT